MERGMGMIHRVGDTLLIGMSGEINARSVQIDIDNLISRWPQGRPSLWIMRHGDAEAYPVNVTIDGTVLTWHIAEADAAIAGWGRYEIQMTDAQTNLLGKSETGKIYVGRALTSGDGTPPEAAQSWVSQVLSAADRAEDAAEKAQEIVESLGGDIDSGLFLPPVTEADNDKVLTVVNGKWAAAELPKYNGAYDVTPLADASTTLLTAQKFMDGNVTVNKIPYYETSNEDDGETVYIGTEVNIYGD